MKEFLRLIALLPLLSLVPGAFGQLENFPGSSPSACPGNLLPFPSGVPSGPIKRLTAGDLDGDLCADVVLLSGTTLAVLHG